MAKDKLLANNSSSIPPVLFNDVAAAPKQVIVVIYDFENFTTFLSIPDIHHYVARYFAFIDQQVRIIFSGGDAAFRAEKDEVFDSLPAKIIHEKFLGDGVMYILEFDANLSIAERDSALAALCNRAWNAKTFFSSRINKKAMEFMPVADVPKRIRFGITYGTVLELTRFDGANEYVGFPINLAARLQKYAGSASFLASARLPRCEHWMPGNDFVKVRAKQLRGRDAELVYIDKVDFERTKKSASEKDLFEPVS